MIRRHFLAVLGGLGGAMVPLPVMAQRKPMPVLGFLSGRVSDGSAPFVAAFKEGLGAAGYIEGRNVEIEYRWAEGLYDRLPALANDLVARNVAVIATSGGPSSARAAKNATSTIPIVFLLGTDPVGLGLVASLARPGGNLTGVSMLTTELNPKRLELLTEIAPTAGTIGLLVNPVYPGTERMVREAEQAADRAGVRLVIARARTEDQIDVAFPALIAQGARALVVGNDAYFASRVEQLVALAAAHALPAIYQGREFPDAGGLMSYGTSLVGIYRHAGMYTGRVLDGAKPGDLPVQQPAVFELVINLKTAKALGLSVPPTLLARADELIE